MDLTVNTTGDDDFIGFVLGYERRFRTWYHEHYLGPFSTDLIGLIGGRLGNVETSGRLGTTLRVGCNLPRHFGAALRPIGDAPPVGAVAESQRRPAAFVAHEDHRARAGGSRRRRARDRVGFAAHRPVHMQLRGRRRNADADIAG